MPLSSDLETLVQALTLLPILVCSIVGSGVTVAKWVQLRRSRASGDRLLARIAPLLSSGELGAALALARGDRSFPARLVERSLDVAGGAPARLMAHVEQVGRQLARDVDYGIGTVALIATLGPLLGLFGTVVGIVLVFNRIAAGEGAVTPSELAGGIGTALYTTVAGLIVGMFALVSHRVLTGMADGAIGQLEAVGHTLVELTAGGGEEP